jgi:hypothetical protein
MESPIMVDGLTSVSFVLQPLPKVTLSGIVADIDTGAPIPGATVVVLSDITTTVPDDWGRSVTTDSSGRYVFDNMTTGNANLSATASGYQERRDGVNTSVRNALNFGLRRLPAPETFTGQITSDSHCIATTIRARSRISRCAGQARSTSSSRGTAAPKRQWRCSS